MSFQPDSEKRVLLAEALCVHLDIVGKGSSVFIKILDIEWTDEASRSSFEVSESLHARSFDIL
jgi:hypothetical protein